ncbi:MAG: phytanoyl-CoA dioxygenase family protein [Nitrospira sp.]|nr:phytanoyl-CoA dioxygenase family protein [Nitrospira sp.]
MAPGEWATAADAYREDGVTILRNVIDPDAIRAIRDDLAGVVEEACGTKMERSLSGEPFAKRTTEVLWEAVCREPKTRNLLYTYAQRVPTLYSLANAAALRQLARSVSMSKPSVREAKVQIFLPWEKLFFQDCHQDINSLDSVNSVTFWIPLHPLTEKTAVRYWVGSHREGPVRHEEIVDEAEAIYLERVPKSLQDKYPNVRTAVASEGDVIAINRLVFHQSPDFEDQFYARWSVVVRYDDIAGQGLFSGTTKFADLAPNSVDKMKERLEHIRAFLAQKPRIDWREKLLRARRATT